MPSHFRLPSAALASPGWGQTQRWGLAGANRAVSTYDQNFNPSTSNLTNQINGGTHTVREQIPVAEYSMTRQPRVAAQRDSLPNSVFFQGYTGAGTGRSCSAVHAPGGAPLFKNFNPNMAGASELHPSTSYNPYPSPSSLYPKVV